jgi:branched-chain amino acid transport system ATP-binding protein
MTFAFENVTKRFGSLVAIDKVSMTFEPGLIYGIIGPNGAGKSTVINLAARSYSVTEGRILLNGTPVQHLKKYQISQVGIARTYQNIRLFDQMSVIGNLEVCLFSRDGGRVWQEVFWPPYARHKRRERLDHCRDLLAAFELQSYANQDADRLPHGSKRMVEIARALVRDPQVLLLDEPAAGHNHAETAELTARLKALRQSNRVLIVVEHNMDLIMSLCDRIMVLHHGTLLFEGTPSEVQASSGVQEAYLGVIDDRESISALAEGRRSQRRLRADRDPIRH